MPVDALAELLVNHVLPENQALRLPSDYPRESHEWLGLIGLAQTEYSLRVAQVHDAIKKMWNALGLKSFMVKGKYKSAEGQQALLCSEMEIHRAQSQVKKWKKVYQRTWSAMGKLKGIGKEDETGQLRELYNGDLLMLSEWMEGHRYWREMAEMAENEACKKGKGRQDLPWIWKIEFPMHATDAVIDAAVKEWTTEGK